MQALTESRQSGDYQPIYDKLDKLQGDSILTSTYILDYNGTAAKLRTYILDGLSDDVTSRIKLLIAELSTENYDFSVFLM